MKILGKIVVVFLILLSIPSQAQSQSVSGENSTEAYPFSRVRQMAILRQQQAKKEGLTFMAGGGLGLLGAVYLDIVSTEALPKVGYGMLQIISAVSMSYGANLYFNGDEFYQKFQLLEFQSNLLDSEGRTKPVERLKFLDASVQSLLLEERARQRRSRHIRAYLEFTTAATAASSIAFSKVKSTSSQLILGFIFLFSTAGGVKDAFFSGSDDPMKNWEMDLGVQAHTRTPTLNLTYQW